VTLSLALLLVLRLVLISIWNVPNASGLEDFGSLRLEDFRHVRNWFCIVRIDMKE
jgi:hypothetical protein